MKIGIVSLGCAKNRVDTENLIGRLTENGHEIVADAREADAIFVNTCGFIDSAKQESVNAILEMAAIRKKGCRIIVTGCLAQRYASQLIEDMPEADFVLGVRDYDKALEALTAERKAYTHGTEKFPDCPRTLTTPPYTAYIKIAEGCDNRCAYCAIPMIRGRYVSRDYDDIVNEAKDLVSRGVTEITLVAQDTSEYGVDLYSKTRLSELLKDIAKIDGIRWVRVLYCYPTSVDEELLDTIAYTPKVCRYLDLPIQHIEDSVLHNMHRKGSPELIMSIFQACRERNITIRTTIMVGFPEEYEEEFKVLMRFVREMRFDRLGAFAFSRERGTFANTMYFQVADSVKEERLDMLMSMQQGISLELNTARIGQVEMVLCEGVDENGEYFGRGEREAPESDGNIRFVSDAPVEPGEYVNVKITRAEPYDLYGVRV